MKTRQDALNYKLECKSDKELLETVYNLAGNVDLPSPLTLRMIRILTISKEKLQSTKQNLI